MALCVGVLQLTDMKAGEVMIVIPSIYTIVYNSLVYINQPPIKGLGHEIEFKYFDKNGYFRI
jgi:hypothetical protein